MLGLKCSKVHHAGGSVDGHNIPAQHSLRALVVTEKVTAGITSLAGHWQQPGQGPIAAEGLLGLCVIGASLCQCLHMQSGPVVWSKRV